MASRRFSPSGRVADSSPLHHYRIVVVAPAVGALVASAGGFLCDRAREGWDVHVLLAEPYDARPLSILGVAGDVLAGDPGSAIRGLPRETTLMVGADLLGGDVHVREDLVRFAGQVPGAVTVWGQPARGEIGHGLTRTRHELSPAATAFKASAMRAAQVDGSAEPVESLYRLRGPAFRRLYSV